MPKLKKLYVLGGIGYGRPFNSIFRHTQGIYRTELPGHIIGKDLPDMILFTGGEDIDERLYNEEYKLKYGDRLNARDSWEKEWFEFAVMNKIPMFGTCRGMQFFTAMTGGSLIQDVTGHFGRHKVQTRDGQRFLVNSIHHQMCLPKQDKFILLANAYGIIQDYEKPVRGSCAIDLHTGPAGDFIEPEALYFPSVNALGVQWHPEGLDERSEAHKWLMNTVQEYLHV